MAKHGCDSFVVVDCKMRRIVYVTQSARAAWAMMEKGRRLEVWQNGENMARLYFEDWVRFKRYIEAEREYIAKKQRRHEIRNERRRLNG